MSVLPRHVSSKELGSGLVKAIQKASDYNVTRLFPRLDGREEGVGPHGTVSGDVGA
jgi:hypothetical protein